MRNGLSDAESRFENLVQTETPIYRPPEKTKKTVRIVKI